MKKWLRRGGIAALFVVVAGLSAAWTVSLLIRTGAETGVPNLIGQTLPEAEQSLSVRGLRLEVDAAEFSDQLAKGQIVSQAISAGTAVRVGRRIGVRVSRGAYERLAPKLTGLRLSAAQTVLESSELKFKVSARACSDDGEATIILAQRPTEGDRLSAEPIDLLLSSGPCSDQFVMPDVSGLTYETVLPEFQEAGFPVRSLVSAEGEGLPTRTILSTVPAAGETLRIGMSVTLTVKTVSDSG